MPNPLATAAMTLITGLFQPTTSPTTAPDLSQPSLPDQPLQHFELQLKPLNPKLPRLSATPYIDVAPNRIIKPYGPSFQFNGLTVYVEPLEMISTPKVRTP